MDEFERVVLRKPEIFVYRVPPRQSNRTIKASDWGLSNPAFTGQCRVLGKGHQLIIQIEDKTSYKLFAKAIILGWPTNIIEPVSDSSRYFTLRITNDDGRQATIGIGFADRSDSFDMNVCIQDFFKQEEAEKQQEKINTGEVKDEGPKLDLGFKSGQTIKINLSGKTSLSKGKEAGAANKIKSPLPMGGLLLPPPGAKKTQQNSGSNDLLGFNIPVQSQNQTSSPAQNDDFGDFGDSSNSGQSWVTF